MLGMIARIVIGLALAFLVSGLVGERLAASAESFLEPEIVGRVIERAWSHAELAWPFALFAIAVAEFAGIRALVYYLGAGALAAIGAAAFDAHIWDFRIDSWLPRWRDVLLTSGVLGGLTYWLVQGHRVGWRGAEEEARRRRPLEAIAGPSGVDRERCSFCGALSLLLGAVPLLFLGWWMVQDDDAGVTLVRKAEREGTAALSQAGLPWATLSVKHDIGEVIGKAPDDAAKTAAFAKAKEVLAPMVGVAGLVERIEDRLTIETASPSRVAVATPARPQEAPRVAADATAEAKRMADDDARRVAAEAEAKRKADEEAARAAAETKRKAAEETRRLAVEAETRRKADDARRLAAETEAKQRKSEDDMRRMAAETKRKADEDARLAAAEEAKRKADEDARRVAAAAETKRRADEEAQRVTAAADAKRKADEETKRKADEEAQRVAAAADAKRKADEETKRKADEEARRVAAVADAKRRADEEAKRKADEEARRVAAAADAKRKADEEARQKADLETRRVAAAADAKRKADEEASRVAAAADVKRKADEEARQKADQETRRLAAAAEARKRAEAAQPLPGAGGVALPRPTAPPAAAVPSLAAAPASCPPDQLGIIQRTQIMFDPRGNLLTSGEQGKLDQLAGAMQQCGDVVLRVAGHAERTETKLGSFSLSRQRAARIAEELAKRGIAKDRVETVAYGNLKPLPKEAAPSSRRVDFAAVPVKAVVSDDCKKELGSMRLQFGTAREQMLKANSASLDSIAARILDCRTTQLVIEGHTDTVGSEAYNLGLSARRARAVRRALIARGVPPGTLTVAGLGESRPLDAAGTPAAHAINRRVEFVIK